jgi:hypothetical protein
MAAALASAKRYKYPSVSSLLLFSQHTPSKTYSKILDLTWMSAFWSSLFNNPCLQSHDVKSVTSKGYLGRIEMTQHTIGCGLRWRLRRDMKRRRPLYFLLCNTLPEKGI